MQHINYSQSNSMKNLLSAATRSVTRTSSLLIVLLFISVNMMAIGPVSVSQAPKMIFEENKNQWPNQVLYQADIRGGRLFLEKNTFTYVFKDNYDFHFPTNVPATIKFHSLKVDFQNSNPQVEVSGNNLFSWSRNYYRGNNPERWAENVRLYGQVYYKELYSAIDMNVYNEGQNLKYDLIVHPGGNINDIKFNYKGADDLSVQFGHLQIKTSVGLIIEQKPYAYQEINGVKREVPCSYKLENNTLGFSVNGEYDKTLPLIIDPTLIASTYTGSTADNWGQTATYDAAGNIYIGGVVEAIGYPTTVGSWSQTFGGGTPTSGGGFVCDISLTQYNPGGTAILFSTYYGGSDNEQPFSLIVNNSNELFVVGRTYSSDFPVTAGVVQATNGGGAGTSDIIVGKFNTVGNLLASTYLGGSGDDCVNVSAVYTVYSETKYNYSDDQRSEIILDSNGDVYVAACTQSANFPTTAGAYSTTFGGIQDGVVFKMNSTLTTLVFSTFLGGSGTDAAYALKLDNSNNVCVTGGTASANFPTTTGVLHATFQGTVDAFIAVLDNTGANLLRSTYLGTTQYDQAYLIEIDSNGDLYVFGQTRGAYPVTAGVYTNANSGQFIHKVNPLLNTTVFSTVVGKGGLTPNISPTAFLVDSCHSIYISGWGRTTSFGHPNSSSTATTGLPITANALQSTTDGGDFYLMVLTSNAKALYYASFFGENTGLSGGRDHVDGGTSRFDKRGVIYQACCASCGSTNAFPTTPSAWSANNNSANCNEAVFKIDLQAKSYAVANTNTTTIGCVLTPVSFSGSGSSGTNFVWNFGDGSAGSTLVSPTHTYTAAGTYSVTLIVYDTLGLCTYSDTADLVLQVNASPTVTAIGSATVCPGQSVSLSASGANTYVWTPAAGLSNANISNPVATPANTTTYTVTGSLSGCTDTSKAVVTHFVPIAPGVGPAQTVCFGASASLSASGASNYSWAPAGNLNNSTIANPVAASVTAATTYTVSTVDINGCIGTATQLVSISNPVAATSPNVTICMGATTTLNASSSPAGVSYVWTPAVDLSNPNIANPVFTPSSPGTWTYTVTVTTALGCTDTDPVTIVVTPLPVVNATPNAIVCSGQTATLTATGASTYVWTPSAGLSNPNISNPVANPAVNTTYTVTGTLNGCSDTAVSTVIVGTEPTAALTYTQSLSCDGITTHFMDSSLNATTWYWDFGNGTTSTSQNNDPITYPYNGTYSITLIVTNPPCADTTSETVVIGDLNALYVLKETNVFTPNGDGINDCFKPVFIGYNSPADLLIQCTTMEVYDRWGIKVFESDGGAVCWDGNTKSNTKAKDGTYYYIIEINKNIYKGYVTLVRDTN